MNPDTFLEYLREELKHISQEPAWSEIEKEEYLRDLIKEIEKKQHREDAGQ